MDDTGTDLCDGPPEVEQTTVALIEDQQVLAGAVSHTLDALPDLSMVGCAATITAGRDLVRALRPAVLVTDYRLPDGDVAAHLAELLALSPETRVLVFTGWADEHSFLRAMAAGAKGFIDKAAPFDEFVDAIRRVAAGEVVVAPRLLPALTKRATNQDRTTLSGRELDVLQLLSDGMSTTEIAAELFLAVNTVRNHIAHLLAKLDVRSRLEAVNAGVRQGLIRYDQPV